jgi:hypothetical protein
MGLRALRRVYFLAAEVASGESRRTVAFVDGQNLYHAARKAFGYSYPNYDAQALASAICARQGWLLVQTRFYTGLHDASENSFWHHFWTAKLAVMRGQGVEVYTRPLRYRNEKVTLDDGTEKTLRIGEERASMSASLWMSCGWPGTGATTSR